MAATREECKRWLDQDIVDRYYKEREEARDREELERQTRVKQNAVNAVKTLEVQVRGGEAEDRRGGVSRGERIFWQVKERCRL